MNRQADLLQNTFFPSHILSGLGLSEHASVAGFRLVFARFKAESGSPTDPVESLLLDQLLAAHLKVGELYSLTATATKLEFKQLYANATPRLLAAICQLVGTLSSYRASTRARRRGRPKRPPQPGRGQARGAEQMKKTDTKPGAGAEKRG